MPPSRRKGSRYVALAPPGWNTKLICSSGANVRRCSARGHAAASSRIRIEQVDLARIGGGKVVVVCGVVKLDGEAVCVVVEPRQHSVANSPRDTSLVSDCSTMSLDYPTL